MGVPPSIGNWRKGRKPITFFPGTPRPTFKHRLFQLDDIPNLYSRKWLEITKHFHPFFKKIVGLGGVARVTRIWLFWKKNSWQLPTWFGILEEMRCLLTPNNKKKSYLKVPKNPRPKTHVDAHVNVSGTSHRNISHKKKTPRILDDRSSGFKVLQ